MNFIFLLLSVVFILFAYYVFRKVVKHDYRKHMRLSVPSFLLEILVFGIHANLIYLALHTKYPYLPPLPHNKFHTLFSVILFAGGALILLLSWLKLGTQRSLGIDKNNLITGGLYQYSRNPQLVGYGLMLAAVTVTYITLMVFIWFLLYIIVCIFMIQSEEEFLIKKYNRDYKNYCNTVSRVTGHKKQKDNGKTKILH